MSLSRRVVKATKRAEHGRHIYAYCNPRTNQVLYSLERSLKPSALKQLPDIGANSTPPTLRKDTWKPLFSVELPDTPVGRKQGLHAFRMLREYRMLHETNWEPPLELSLRYGSKKVEAIQDRLDKRGGSKSERPHDVLRRKKKNLRKRIIMDQRANSIADLAAVLLEHEEVGATLKREQQVLSKTMRYEEVEEMLQRAEEAKNGKVEELQQRRQELLKDLKEGRTQESIIKTKKHRVNILRNIEKTQFSAAAVEWAQLSETRREQELQFWEGQASLEEEEAPHEKAVHKDFAQKRSKQGYNMQQIAVAARVEGLEISPEQLAAAPKQSTHAAETDTPLPTSLDEIESSEELDYVQLLPSFPPQFDPLSNPKLFDKLPKNDPLRTLVKSPNRADFTTEGIVVRWANTLDAEYAAEWPADVEHVGMGIARHTHPKQVSDEPIVDLEVFKALNWKSQKFAWEKDSEQLEQKQDTWARVQAIRAQMGLVDDPDKPERKLIEEKNLSPFVRKQLEEARKARQLSTTSEEVVFADQEPSSATEPPSSAQPPSATETPSTTEPSSDTEPSSATEPLPATGEPSTTELEVLAEEPQALTAEEESAIIQEAAGVRRAALERLVWKPKAKKYTLPMLPSLSAQVDTPSAEQSSLVFEQPPPEETTESRPAV